jgi:hypothetical protein
MIAKSYDKNKYGGITWRIKLNSEYHILIHETNESTYVVEFKEAYYIMYRTNFTYLSNKSMSETIEETFNKVNVYLVEEKKIYWNELTYIKFKVLNEFHFRAAFKRYHLTQQNAATVLLFSDFQ